MSLARLSIGHIRWPQKNEAGQFDPAAGQRSGRVRDGDTMRTPKILAMLLLGGALATAAIAQDEPPPVPDGAAATDPGPDASSVDYFYQPLSSYGRWTYRDGYGEVWLPTIQTGWRPYTTGHWVYTDEGWAWVADEPWGWATFHYGRWYWDDQIGWAWVPGTVWAPAWVAWRSGNGYVGWAPLPPQVGFTFGVGVQLGGVDLGVAIAPAHYCFVAENAILAPSIVTVVAPPTQNVTIINRTTNITNITVVNNRIVNNGVSVQHIEQVTGHAVPRMQIAASASASARGRVSGTQVAFYQPPAVVKAAQAHHAEFGTAMATQVEAQKRSRVVGQQVAAATHTAPPATKGNPPPTNRGQVSTSSKPTAPSKPAAPSIEELQKRHTDEASKLAQQQAKERDDLAKQQAAEVKAKGASAELSQKHAAQAKAQQTQHQTQQQQLQNRHQQELQAAQKNTKERRPPV
jgi:hypothetical protein